MPKGVSDRYTLERRSAAAKKGAAARKRSAALRAATPVEAPVQGSQAHRVMRPGELREIIDRAIAAVRQAQAQSEPGQS